MLTDVLRHLEKLQIDLAAIDPQHACDAADAVAAMADALRCQAKDAPNPPSQDAHGHA